jgi:hypothetical protein
MTIASYQTFLCFAIYKSSPMSFRFSISDFITVDYMVVNIKSRLSDKSSEYQALLRGIDALQNALQHVDGLHPTRPATEIDSIEYTALSCRKTLEEFLKNVGEYKRSLGYSCQSNVIISVTDRLPLELGKKDDALEFDSRQPEVIINYQVSSYSLSYFKSHVPRWEHSLPSRFPHPPAP